MKSISASSHRQSDDKVRFPDRLVYKGGEFYGVIRLLRCGIRVLGLLKEDGDAVPEEFASEEWEFQWKMSVRAILHHTEKLIPKAAIAKATGINQQQLTHYASGFRVAMPAMKAKILSGIRDIAKILSAIS